MKKWLKRMSGLRAGREGQTTAEYAIIVALIAVSSIAIILIFGDQIRSLFAGEAQRLATDEEVQVEDKTGGADEATSGSITTF
jgi:Flp pilus assembly pilin Flp